MDDYESTTASSINSQQHSTTPVTTVSHQGSRRILYRDVIVINDSNDDRVLAENVAMVVDSSDNVYFGVFIQTLRSKNLIEANSSIFFFDVERCIFVHQGKDPIMPDVRVPLRKFSSTEEIKIKFRPAERRAPTISQAPSMFARNHVATSAIAPSTSSTMRRSCFTEQRGPSTGGMIFGNNIHTSSQGDSFITTQEPSQGMQYWSDTPCNSVAQSEMFGDDVEYIEEDLMSNQFDFMNGGAAGNNAKPIPREKRVKERKIGYVHSRVQEWRNYYEVGYVNEQGRLQKVNLDVAAGLVGLSRKTLDDYYKYIRKAEDLNFDFKGRSEEKIGVLRNFVRDRQNRNHPKIEEQFSQHQQQQNSQPLQESDHTEDSSASSSQVTQSRAKQLSLSTNSVKVEEHSYPRQAVSRDLPPPPPYKHEIEWIKQHLQLQNQSQTLARNTKMMTASAVNEQFASSYSYSSSEMDIEGCQASANPTATITTAAAAGAVEEDMQFALNDLNLFKQQSSGITFYPSDHHLIHQSSYLPYNHDQISMYAACPVDAISPEFDDLDYLNNNEMDMRRHENED